MEYAHQKTQTTHNSESAIEIVIFYLLQDEYAYYIYIQYIYDIYIYM
jgi:hypothetical protein